MPPAVRSSSPSADGILGTRPLARLLATPGALVRSKLGEEKEKYGEKAESKDRGKKKGRMRAKAMEKGEDELFSPRICHALALANM